jgi:hypothetical protein
MEENRGKWGRWEKSENMGEEKPLKVIKRGLDLFLDCSILYLCTEFWSLSYFSPKTEIETQKIPYKQSGNYTPLLTNRINYVTAYNPDTKIIFSQKGFSA